MRFLLLAFLLSGAARAEVLPEYQKYFDAFMSELATFNSQRPDSTLAVNTSHLLIDGGSVMQNVGAQCRQGEKDGLTRVLIDTEYWPRHTEMERERIIFHELGHCLLHRQHSNQERNGRPASLMHHAAADAISDEDYRRDRGSYLEELFTGALIEGKGTR